MLTATYTATITVEINPHYYPEAGDDPETLRRILEEEINDDGDLSVLLDGVWGADHRAAPRVSTTAPRPS